MFFFYWLILIMPLENHPIWEHHVGPLTIVKYVGLACVASAVIHLPMRKGGAPPLLATWQARMFVLLFLFAFESYATQGYSAGAGIENPFLTYVSFMLLFFVTVTMVDSVKRLKLVLLMAIGSVGFASLYILREWQKSGFALGFRPGWVVGDANYFTVSVSACVPLALYLTAVSREWRERLYCLTCLVLTLVATWLGASRGGFIALTVSCIWLLWHTKHRWKIMGILAILALPVLTISSNSPLRRLFQPTKFDVASSQNHELVLEAGIRMTLAHPLFGVGLGQFRRQVLEYADPRLQRAFIAHDAYVEVSSEMGIPALIVYIMMLGFCLGSLSRAHKATLALRMKPLQEAALGIQGGLVGSSTAVMFVSGQNTKLYWLMIFLSMVLPSLIKAQRKQSGDSAMSFEFSESPKLEGSGHVPAEISLPGSVSETKLREFADRQIEVRSESHRGKRNV